jgi:uncharacterized membrane protein required for colicin V production
MFLVAGWKQGVVKETAGFIGIIIVFFLSYALKGVVGNLLCSILPFFNFGSYIEGLVSLNILIYHAIAFFLLFALFLSLYRLLLKVSNSLQKLINYTIILQLPSKVFGAIIGFIEGWIIVFIILVVLLVPFRNVDHFKESKLADVVLFETPILSKTVQPFTKGVVEIYNVSSKISMEEMSINDANLESINIMLKYKLVSRKSIEHLVKIHKLDSVKGIEKVLEKYK